jgi:hypothetical protein
MSALGLAADNVQVDKRHHFLAVAHPTPILSGTKGPEISRIHYNLSTN